MSHVITEFECLVCGKIFKGQMELSRHQTAPTLRHLTSKLTNSIFSLSNRCRRCGVIFTSADHLTKHKTQSSCDSTRVVKALESTNINEATQTRWNTLFRNSYTVECLVCGKLYPSLLDLNRHTSATLLKHTFSGEVNAVCDVKCQSCGIYFISDESLESHQANSSCNQEVYERLLASGEGQASEVVERKPSHKRSAKASHTSEDTKRGTDLDEVASRQSPRSASKTAATSTQTVSSPLPVPEARVTRGSVKETPGTNPAKEVPQESAPKKRGRKPMEEANRSDRSVDNVKATIPDEHSSTSQKPKRHAAVVSSSAVDQQVALEAGGEAGAAERREWSVDELIEHQRANKQPRLIVPEDRKAYYSLLSLLIDKQLWANRRQTPAVTSSSSSSSSSDPQTQLTASEPVPSPAMLEADGSAGYERFVRPEHWPLLEKLRTLLYYDC